ncbi:MAG: Lrp/AsnC ligand binding domain-containing protein [Muribaculaceae bacterium]|nr:Lrp/AsnC ligand binding domain-containing protein [Muribaculaceae bacterium]
MPHNFDKLDVNILTMLAGNARKPYLEISRECGVSGAAVHQRIQRLTANNVILGSECLLNPEALGYETCAYVGVVLRDPSLYAEMVEKLKAIPEVVECYYTSGQYDIFAKVFAHNNDHLLSLLQRIQELGWARTETLICFKQIFKRQVPVDAKD